MSFAIKNALIAIPALVTLVLGVTFIILVFVLVIRAISIMPLLRKALKIYVVKNSNVNIADMPPEAMTLWDHIIRIFKGGSNKNSNNKR